MKNNTIDFKNNFIEKFENNDALNKDEVDKLAFLENELTFWKDKCRHVLESIESIYVEFGLDLNFTYLNKHSLQLLNYTQDDVERGLHLTAIFPDWEVERMQQAVTKTLCNDFGNIVEWEILARNGNLLTIQARGFPIIEDGNVIGIKVIGQDITKLRHVQKQYADSEKRFINTFNRSPIGMAIYCANGTIIKTNNLFLEYFSDKENGINSNNIRSYFNLSREMQTQLNKGEAIQFETQYDLHGGSTKYFEWHVSRINEKHDNIQTFIVQVIEISLRKLSEQNKLRKVQFEVESVSKIANGLRKQINKKFTIKDIISKSPKVSKIFYKIPQIAASADASVLIRGESGTGKEVVARLVHDLGKRKPNPFVSINCGSIPDNLIESELFGHKAGAFTDAKNNKKGKFLLAQGGTLFLDEVGDMPLKMQVKLLRVLEEKRYFPLGSDKEIAVDVRIIAATHQPLEVLVREKEFRQDLYYRLNVVKIELPPLRERVEDILPLSYKFVKNANERFDKNVSGFSAEVEEYLLNYDYPGNIRELENIIDQMVIFSTNAIIKKSDLPEEMVTYSKDIIENENTKRNKYYVGDCLIGDEEEKMSILCALEEAKGNKTLAANRLGIHRTTLIRKMKKW